VLEATRIGGGTSGISFARTNAHKKPPKPYHDLNVAGMKAHAALADEFGATPWWHGSGSLEWEAEPDRAAQRENIEQLRSWGYAAEWITLRQVRELEPDIDPATIGDAPVAFFPEEGWLDPVVYAHAMLSAARLRHNAKVICGARVVDLITAGDRVTGVRVADGTQYEADTVVNCAGRWTNEATRDAGLHLPLAPTVGFLVFTPPVAASLSGRGIPFNGELSSIRQAFAFRLHRVRQNEETDSERNRRRCHGRSEGAGLADRPTEQEVDAGADEASERNRPRECGCAYRCRILLRNPDAVDGEVTPEKSDERHRNDEGDERVLLVKEVTERGED
jgi:glycine/D-amino acid oxidase-like deaminating enzyme